MWRILRAYAISLQRRRSWCVSTDPQFVAKVADIVSLYLEPTENAVIICIDGKPHIQALERCGAQQDSVQPVIGCLRSR